MIHRRFLRLFSAVLPAALILGCGDDYESPTDTGLGVVVTPAFAGLDEGATLQLTATLNGSPAAVTWESANPARATVSATGLVTGVNACAGAPATPVCTANLVPITATLTADPTEKTSASVTVAKLQGTGVQNGVPVTGIASAGARGSGLLYRIFVPAGAASLTITLSGGPGDVDLYVRRQTPPTITAGGFTCASENGGNTEVCTITAPATGTWYMLLGLWDPYSGVTLTATYN